MKIERYVCLLFLKKKTKFMYISAELFLVCLKTCGKFIIVLYTLIKFKVESASDVMSDKQHDYMYMMAIL